MASASLPRLHRAAARGEHWKIKQYVNAGDAVNALDADGGTALLCAVEGGHIKCVEILLAAGADPSTYETGRCFPLYEAAHNQNSAIVKALIGANVDINAITDCPAGGTALCIAAHKGDEAVVRLFLMPALIHQKLRWRALPSLRGINGRPHQCCHDVARRWR